MGARAGDSCSTSTERSRRTSPCCSRSTSGSSRATAAPHRGAVLRQLAGLSEEAIVGGWLGVDGPLLARRWSRADRGGTAAEAADGRTVTEPLREALRYAATRVPVAIVSGAFRAEIEPVVEAAGIAGDIATIVAADDVTQGKPHPEGYLQRSSGSKSTPPTPSHSRTPRQEWRRRRPPDCVPRRSRHPARRAALGRRRARRPDRRRPRATTRRLGQAPMILAIDQGTTGTTCLVVDEAAAAGRSRLPGDRPALSRARMGRARSRGDLGQRPPHCGGRARRCRNQGSRAQRGGDHEPAGDDGRLGAPERAPVHSAIVWQDRRTAARCAELPAEVRPRAHRPRV